MPKKPTQEDIVNLARKGGNDAHLFVLEKVLDVKEDVSELELAIVGTENKLSTLDDKVTSLTTDIDSTISEMEEDVLDKISSLEKELSNLDNNFRTFDMSGGIEQIIKNLSVVKGIKGEKGDKGDPGKDGKDGQDAVVDLDELRLSIIEEFPTTDEILELISESTDARIGFLENELESLDVKEKLESLEGDDRLDYSAIKNTPDMDSVASQVALRMPHGGGTSLEVFDSTGKVGSGSALKFIGATVTHDGHMGTVNISASGLSNVVEDTTPQLGGELDAQGNNIIDLGDVTFKTGAQGGTLRTGTSAADKFVLQAYDVNDTTYRTLIQANAGNDVTLNIKADYLDIEDATDTSKKVTWDVSGATASTATDLVFAQTANRTITFPDIAGTIQLVPTTPTTYTPSGTTQTITFADNDQLAIIDLGSATGNVTLTLSGMTAGGAYTIKVIQGATARNLVFPASVIASSSQTAWDTSTQTLTMTATDDAVDVVGLTYDGTSTLMTAEFDLS